MQSKCSVGVIDYGTGNIRSIVRALIAVGIYPVIVSKQQDFGQLDGLLLPGVGCFSKAMAELNKRSFRDQIIQFVTSGKPILGICLGMQVLFAESNELSKTEGLNLLEGSVTWLGDTGLFSRKLALDGRLPRIGWDTNVAPSGKVEDISVDMTPFLGDFYYANSFGVRYLGEPSVMSTYSFGGLEWIAAVAKENILGTQFHPEKSGERGQAVLNYFKNQIERSKHG